MFLFVHLVMSKRDLLFHTLWEEPEVYLDDSKAAEHGCYHANNPLITNNKQYHITPNKKHNCTQQLCFKPVLPSTAYIGSILLKLHYTNTASHVSWEERFDQRWHKHITT